MEPDVTEDEEGTDPTEILRLLILGIGVVLTIWSEWDFISTRVEYMVAKQKLRTWWDGTVEAGRKLARAERETVIEARWILEENRAES